MCFQLPAWLSPSCPGEHSAPLLPARCEGRQMPCDDCPGRGGPSTFSLSDHRRSSQDSPVRNLVSWQRLIAFGAKSGHPMNCFFSPANFNFSPLNFKFSPQPPLFSPHPPVFSPLRYVRSRPTISCELGGCSHFAPHTTQIKTSGDGLGQPNRMGWRKTGTWHAPDGTYTAVTGAIRVSVGPACRNQSLSGRYSKHKKNN
jgi:hypothetical protein